MAAGEGKRMQITTPKSLLKIRGEPIIVRLVKQFRRFGVQDVFVIIGFKSEMMKDTLAPLKVTLVTNPHFSKTDNMMSFRLAGEYIQDDMIMCHGDLVLENRMFELLIENRGEIILPVDTKSMDSESMKIQLTEDRVTAIGKRISLQETCGESIPFMKFSAEAVHELMRLIDKYIEDNDLQRFLEDAVMDLLRAGKYQAELLDATGLKWMEIDTQEDYQQAVELFR